MVGHDTLLLLLLNSIIVYFELTFNVYLHPFTIIYIYMHIYIWIPLLLCISLFPNITFIIVFLHHESLSFYLINFIIFLAFNFMKLLHFLEDSFVYVYECMYMYKCMCTHICVHEETREQSHISSSIALHPTFFRQDLSWILELTNLSRLHGYQAPVIHLSSFLALGL